MLSACAHETVRNDSAFCGYIAAHHQVETLFQHRISIINKEEAGRRWRAGEGVSRDEGRRGRGGQSRKGRTAESAHVHDLQRILARFGASAWKAF